MLRINVTTAEAVITETELITSGRKGLRCAFTFSDDWAGLAKTVIVQGAATRDIALLATNEITVPAECVDKAQFPLKIGVYGARADGSIAIPTIWASFGKILPGVKPSDIPPDELTPDVVAQIQEAANNALYLARNVQSMADGGALDGVSPAVTVTSITGGHNIKITDRDHPDGQDFDVPDGEDGADGSGVWYTTSRISGYETPFVRRRDLIGRAGAAVQIHDLLFAPDVGEEGEPTTLYEITSVGAACALNRLCKMQGEDGTSPSITITEITGGHRITITDEAHPQGQSFDVMDGSGSGGGGVTVDDALSGSSTNPVQNKVVKAALDGKGTYSKPASGIPKTDMAEDVQTSLAKANTALQNHQSLAAYRTSADQDTIDRQQNAAIEAKYTKPGTGIPKTDMAEDVQASLDKADTALQEVDAQDVRNLDQYIDSQDYAKRSWVQQQGYLTKHQDISGKADKVTEVTVATDGAVTQALDAGKVYHFTGALTSLTITLNAAGSGQLAQYHFDFDCGSTAPTVTIPNSVTMPSGNFEASKHYEVDILNNYGMVMAWATS